MTPLSSYRRDRSGAAKFLQLYLIDIIFDLDSILVCIKFRYRLFTIFIPYFIYLFQWSQPTANKFQKQDDAINIKNIA